MKNGDKVKAFVQVGLMKKPEWRLGTYMCKVGDHHKVIVCGNIVELPMGKVKEWKTYSQDEMDQFSAANWESLKSSVGLAMATFFPDEKLTYDDTNLVITCERVGVELTLGTQEMESIVRFSEVPTWVVGAWKTIPATRWEPEDADFVNMGSNPGTVNATKLFVDAVWTLKSEGFWEEMHYNMCPANDEEV